MATPKSKSKRPKTGLPTAPRADSALPSGYAAFLEDLKLRIRTAQVKAALSVNRELIELYWHIGKAIVGRQRAEGWGKAVVERLSRDLQAEFPGVAGFSPRNIWRMRAFYLAYMEAARKLPQLVAEMDGTNLPQPVAEIPWGHNSDLLDKVHNPIQRLWYAQQTTAYGWSRAMLVHQIESDLYARQGKAVTNFKATLPAPQSDLAHQLIKDPYNFDFLTLSTDAQERELESGLLAHIRKFLLELGAGFAFVGQQVHLEVEGEDFYIDLLFYHLRLRCYVVIDLKIEPFKPEFAGKIHPVRYHAHEPILIRLRSPVIEGSKLVRWIHRRPATTTSGAQRWSCTFHVRAKTARIDLLRSMPPSARRDEAREVPQDSVGKKIPQAATRELSHGVNFYLSAVDDRLRHADDKPSIGLILCKSGKKVIAEYALRDLAKPVGVSSYVVKLVESLPAAFRGSLPSPEQLKAEMRTTVIKTSKIRYSVAGPTESKDEITKRG